MDITRLGKIDHDWIPEIILATDHELEDLTTHLRFHVPILQAVHATARHQSWSERRTELVAMLALAAERGTLLKSIRDYMNQAERVMIMADPEGPTVQRTVQDPGPV